VGNGDRLANLIRFEVLQKGPRKKNQGGGITRSKRYRGREDSIRRYIFHGKGESFVWKTWRPTEVTRPFWCRSKPKMRVKLLQNIKEGPCGRKNGEVFKIEGVSGGARSGLEDKREVLEGGGVGGEEKGQGRDREWRAWMGTGPRTQEGGGEGVGYRTNGDTVSRRGDGSERHKPAPGRGGRKGRKEGRLGGVEGGEGVESGGKWRSKGGIRSMGEDYKGGREKGEQG